MKTYGEIVLDHFRHPRNKGPLPNATLSHEATNPLCGDRVRIQLLLEGDMVADARFTANACALCVAAASMLTELVKRAPLDEVETLTVPDLLKALQTTVPGTRAGCIRLPLTIMHGALLLYRRRTT